MFALIKRFIMIAAEWLWETLTSPQAIVCHISRLAALILLWLYPGGFLGTFFAFTTACLCIVMALYQFYKGNYAIGARWLIVPIIYFILPLVNPEAVHGINKVCGALIAWFERGLVMIVTIVYNYFF